jgi:hypothetical protein
MTTPGEPLTPEALAALTRRPEPGTHHATIEIDGELT